jgi:hypothetical protein
MFQKTVNRQYTTGFPGEILRDGPMRAKRARISSVTIGADAGASTNRVSRAFGYSGEVASTGITNAATEATVDVGGANFFGVLFHPKHYVLNGTTAGGSLAASLDLPQGAEAEFADMVTGLCVELFNETTGAKSVAFGDGIAFVPRTITGANNPLALPYGALVSYPAGGAVPTGMIAIPNARVTNAISMSASALGALVSGYTIGQLTQ